MSSIPIPSKGDIVTIENKQYRVLKVSGTIVEVFAMYDASTSQAFNATSKTVKFTSGYTGQQYKGSDLDTYLNETFFAALSVTMQAAIVPKTINQDMWKYSSSVPNSETYYRQTFGSDTRYYFDTDKSFGYYGTSEVGTRNVYALSIRDIIDYLGVVANGDFADTDIWQMFWNRSTNIEEYPYLRSADRNNFNYAFYVSGYNGYLDSSYSNFTRFARPAFQIDWDILYPSTPTLTFKHFYDAGTIGSGTVKFRHYSQTEPTPSGYTDCLTFTGETSEFTLKATNKDWNGTLEWSTDHTNWTTLAGTEAMQSVGKKLYLRGKGNTNFCSPQGVRWQLSAKAGCSGNIQTLLDWENPPTNIPTSDCYSNMFYDCTNLTTAPALPATMLAQSCYSYMFCGCTNLTTAPSLPATTLTNYCYLGMFYNCANLTTAPELPATTLSDNCYNNMFFNCINLTTAPELPATNLANRCYYYMFKYCAKLKLSTTQTTEYKTPWRIPSSGTISSTPNNWNYDMLADTGGTFKSNPRINTTYYGAW